MNKTSDTDILIDEHELRGIPRSLRTRRLMTRFAKLQRKGHQKHPKPRFRLVLTETAVLKRESRKTPMRVLLRNVTTMKFFRSKRRWTKNPSLARDFQHGWWAALQAFTLNPRHLAILYQFGDERYNINIPVLSLGQSR